MGSRAALQRAYVKYLEDREGRILSNWEFQDRYRPHGRNIGLLGDVLGWTLGRTIKTCLAAHDVLAQVNRNNDFHHILAVMLLLSNFGAPLVIVCSV